MSRFESLMLHFSMVLVGGTGLVYAWMRYLTAPSDPYAVVNHPWQPTVQHLHIWVAPLLVFAAGLVWTNHIWAHFRRGVKTARLSGLTLLLNLTPMVLSGYLIQTAVAPAWRTTWIVVHLTSSGLWSLGYGVHLYAFLHRRRVARRKAAAATRGALEATPPHAGLGASRLESAREA